MGCTAKVAELCGRVVGAQVDGHVCLGPLDEAQCAALRDAPQAIACIAPGDAAEGTAAGRRPFVLYGKLLYTWRAWKYEQLVLTQIRRMAATRVDKKIAVPEDGIFAQMEKCQRDGVAMMCNHRFSLLTGGPGTGKTFTIARAVKLIQEQEDVRLGLAAPTGKAAARMKEAMEAEAQKLGLQGRIPNASTLHTLLKPNYDLVTFKHNRQNPLSLDWLIVDEASMIDLPMMAKLLDALPSGCRLTLVGDDNQLASVEPGRVFGDLCRMEGLPKCELNISRRFPHGGEIDSLAKAVNAGKAETALAMLKAEANSLLHYVSIEGANPEHWAKILLPVLQDRFAAFASQTTAKEALDKLNDCRILCAMRNGPYGINRLNRFVQETLEKANGGRPVPVPMMITANNSSLGVNNGDVGVVMPGQQSLHLKREDGSTREISLALLPDLETAFASTIHKAQGSEYGDVVIVLPPTPKMPDSTVDNPLLTREILYTAITRTKGQVFVFAGDPSIRTCCERNIQRQTGLDSRAGLTRAL